MKKEHRELLRQNYNLAVDDYCRCFCEKHDYDYDPRQWAGGERGYGEIIEIADMYISFSDIKYDIDNDLPESMYVQYYDYCMEVAMLEDDYTPLRHVNYEWFSKGCRPYSVEQLRQIKSSKKRIEDMKEELRTLCEQERSAQ